MKVGDVCVKVAGRDAGRVCVVIDILEDNRVLVDGETRRRKVNPAHLVLIGKQARVEKGASHEKVLEAITGAKEIELAKIVEKKPGVKDTQKSKMRGNQKISSTLEDQRSSLVSGNILPDVVGKVEDVEIKKEKKLEGKGAKEKLEKKGAKKVEEKPVKKKATKKE